MKISKSNLTLGDEISKEYSEFSSIEMIVI